MGTKKGKITKELMNYCKFSLQVRICKKVISLVIIINKIERKNMKFFHSFEFGKNVISDISGRPLIGQTDSLSVLLLVDVCIEYKKGRNDRTDTFWG